MSVRHESLRRGSVVQSISKEVPWDIFDRLFLPLVYCHAVAIIFTGVIQFFEIRFAFSTFGIFTIFSLATVALVLFYHNLKVSLIAINFSICLTITHKTNNRNIKPNLSAKISLANDRKKKNIKNELASFTQIDL